MKMKIEEIFKIVFPELNDEAVNYLLTKICPQLYFDFNCSGTPCRDCKKLFKEQYIECESFDEERLVIDVIDRLVRMCMEVPIELIEKYNIIVSERKDRDKEDKELPGRYYENSF